ncbi:hypothetical protein OG21DRAFT_1507834 [Imleria badia]|nr:hypothetical protein OG21DRAFT_1507834 [Imleria badia]
MSLLSLRYFEPALFLVSFSLLELEVFGFSHFSFWLIVILCLDTLLMIYAPRGFQAFGCLGDMTGIYVESVHEGFARTSSGVSHDDGDR